MKRLPRLERAASAVRSIRSTRRPAESQPEYAAPEAVEPEPGFLTLVGLLPDDLLRQALTHSSWVDRRTASYERLEFLGDSVLGLAIASALYDRYPDKEEGELARIKAFVVSRASCAQVSDRLGVATLILEQPGASLQKKKEAAKSPTVLGNVLEALIGASFLAHGYARTARAVVDIFDAQMAFAISGHVDYKTTLQELIALRGLHPSYRLVAEEGPPHAREFTSEVLIDSVSYGQGVGKTIKMSEQLAAREALARLAAKPVEE